MTRCRGWSGGFAWSDAGRCQGRANCKADVSLSRGGLRTRYSVGTGINGIQFLRKQLLGLRRNSEPCRRGMSKSAVGERFNVGNCGECRVGVCSRLTALGNVRGSL